ncbi:MAG: WecB/TagA/CpsF family glycosyltransferase [Candidatus Riflebacteria bacterium]|nr:WecB/TagA/CpsF family glycosyltransferase [Candidatus Riflebacteria bacterium]
MKNTGLNIGLSAPGSRGCLRGLWHSFGLVFLLESTSILRRCLDILFAVGALTLLSPLLIFVAFLTSRRGKPLLVTVSRIGRWCEPYEEYAFPAPETPAGQLLLTLRLVHLPRLINLLKGDLSFLGPRSTAPGQLDQRERSVRRRFDVRPGLFHLWWTARRADIALDDEAASDSGHSVISSTHGDLGAAFQAFPALLYGAGALYAPEQIELLGIRMDNLTMTETVDAVMTRLRSGIPGRISFVTAECANLAHNDAAYRDVLCGSSLVLGDGIGIRLAGKILGCELRQSVSGTDLFPLMLSALTGSGFRLFLLGGRPGVPENVAEYVRREFPGIEIAGVQNGYYSVDEESDVIDHIRDSGAHLLLVAFGSPRQETWLARHLPETGAILGVGVGGLFDYYSGRLPRAPYWMREIGLEWAFRLYHEPGRLWRRYLMGCGKFLLRVFMEKTGRPSPTLRVIKKHE